jgi:hypothetical protein
LERATATDAGMKRGKDPSPMPSLPRYLSLLAMTRSTWKASHPVSSVFIFKPYSIDNMFQHKYLIYNRECTLLTYAVQTKIKIDDQVSFKDVSNSTL